MTFLALDVGNTRLKWARYDQAHPGAKLLGHGAVFLENIDHLAEGDWKAWPAPRHMLGCIVAGEAIRRRVEEQMEWWDVPARWVVPSAQEAGLTNGYDHPTRLGADRWVAMIGAFAKMKSQVGTNTAKPMVVVMVGTAVTVEAGTAGLRVPTGEVQPFPTNTSDALTSGGTFAIAGAIERMVQHVRAHCQADPVCYMTGGAGWKMAPSMSVPFELVDSLLFDGLLEIALQRGLNQLDQR